MQPSLSQKSGCYHQTIWSKWLSLISWRRLLSPPQHGLQGSRALAGGGFWAPTTTTSARLPRLGWKGWWSSASTKSTWQPQINCHGWLYSSQHKEVKAGAPHKAGDSNISLQQEVQDSRALTCVDWWVSAQIKNILQLGHGWQGMLNSCNNKECSPALEWMVIRSQLASSPKELWILRLRVPLWIQKCLFYPKKNKRDYAVGILFCQDLQQCCLYQILPRY